MNSLISFSIFLMSNELSFCDFRWDSIREMRPMSSSFSIENEVSTPCCLKTVLMAKFMLFRFMKSSVVIALTLLTSEYVSQFPVPLCSLWRSMADD